MCRTDSGFVTLSGGLSRRSWYDMTVDLALSTCSVHSELGLDGIDRVTWPRDSLQERRVRHVQSSQRPELFVYMLHSVGFCLIQDQVPSGPPISSLRPAATWITATTRRHADTALMPAAMNFIRLWGSATPTGGGTPLSSCPMLVSGSCRCNSTVPDQPQVSTLL